MSAKLSVNVNKVATLRNSRGGNKPDLVQVAIDCQRFGADGITVHPRPDERHIRYTDVLALKAVIDSEFNIEGNPAEEAFVELVLRVKPTQVTLVPDTRGQLTSDHGWNTIASADFLKAKIDIFRAAGIRVSLFLDPDMDMVKAASTLGCERIELYTEAYAGQFKNDSAASIIDYKQAGSYANALGLGVNAGHDLSLENLRFFAEGLPFLAEVSIGHALISDCLYYGLQNTIQMYKRCLTHG